MGEFTAFNKPPFKIQEEGWGEFDMTIVLTAPDKGGEHTIAHDLNFQEQRYETKHTVVSEMACFKSFGFLLNICLFKTFKNPKPALLDKLRETGPVPGDENGKKRGDESAKKKKRPDKGV